MVSVLVMSNIEEAQMDRLRPTPDREKFQHAFGMVRLYQRHVLAFVEERLGYAAMHELRSVWQAAIMPIHEDYPDQKKYDNAYNNWLWMARCSHDFLADLLKRDEVVEYKRLLLQLYKRQQDNPDLAIYRMFGNHTALSKAWLHQMQWMTPIELTSRKKTQVTCVVHDCKILQTAATTRICRVDCRSVGTALARKVYHLTRVTTDSDHGCTITLTPLED
jgi:hypothetical protein